MKTINAESGGSATTEAAGNSSLHRANPLASPSPSLTFTQLRHEMRTPLNQIIGFTDLLIEDAEAAANADLARDLRKVNAAGKRLQKLVGETLDLATPGSPTAQEISLRSALPRTTEHDRTGEAETIGQSACVLVVDDEASNREILGRRLERQGHLVVAAESGEEALRELAETPFDLVLLDIIMPDMNGFDVLSRMKAEESLRHIPVIMVSALDDLESVVRCIQLGADDYLPKPFNTVLLEARVGASLEKKRLRDSELRLYKELQRNHSLLKELQQVRDDLTKLIVEDIQQPLTAFMAGIRSVPDMGPLNDDQKECIELAATSGEQLVAMVSNLV
ncbi:MAG TPA: response regulator [Armatimonadota bacterium]|jgi:DNA-binding response OmpR family regulator